MIRRREGSGAKEFSGTGSLRRLYRCWREAAEKMRGNSRFVIRRVLDGGEGLTREGTFQRSMEEGFSVWGAFFRWEAEVGEIGGEDAWACMVGV